MNADQELTPAGRVIVFSGAVVGLIAGGAACFLLPVGIVPAILLGMGGPVLGIAIARLIAKAMAKRKE